MLFSNFAFVAVLVAMSAAQDTTTINLNNIPAQCTDVCTQVAAIVNGCDTSSNNDDTARLQCICTANSANTLLPNCQSCITQYNGPADNNVQNLLNSCSFTTTAVGPSSTGVVGGIGGVGATAAQTTTSVATVTSIVSSTSVIVVSSSMSGSRSQSMGGRSTSMSASGSGAATQTANAAPARTAGAAMGAGALAFAMGML